MTNGKAGCGSVLDVEMLVGSWKAQPDVRKGRQLVTCRGVTVASVRVRDQPDILACAVAAAPDLIRAGWAFLLDRAEGKDLAEAEARMVKALAAAEGCDESALRARLARLLALDECPADLGRAMFE